MNCREFLRQTKDSYAWPGGYPRFAICDDGGTLCFDCVRSERKRILLSIATNCADGWKVEAFDINWEDAGLYCAHCGKRIELAYGEDEEEEELS